MEFNLTGLSYNNDLGGGGGGGGGGISEVGGRPPSPEKFLTKIVNLIHLPSACCRTHLAEKILYVIKLLLLGISSVEI